MRHIQILLPFDNEPVVVAKTDYIKAKTKDLIEFGYTTLTEQDVADQLEKILTHDKELSIIGAFMKDEIVLP